MYILLCLRFGIKLGKWDKNSIAKILGGVARSEEVTAFCLVIPATSYVVNKVTHHDYNFSDVPLACDDGRQI